MSNDLDAVIKDLRAHRERLVRDLVRIDSALNALTGDGVASSASATPMIDRVAQVFDEYPTRVFTAETVLEVLLEEGWASDASDPENAMRTTLSRMSKRGDIKRVDRGQYQKVPGIKFVDPWAQPEQTVTDDPWATPPAKDNPWPSTTVKTTVKGNGIWPSTTVQKASPFD